jgi:hypothetical protein
MAAKVQVKVSGGDIQEKQATTVGELKKLVNAEGYVATVNGEPESDDYSLSDYEFVSLSKPVKAG